jgi:hypothetical protein
MFNRYYHIGGNASNNAWFFENAPEGVLCPQCGSCVNETCVPRLLEIHKSKKYDISFTTDLQTIVSETFLALLESCGITNISRPIQTTIGTMYQLVVNDYAIFDSEKRETRFLEMCSVCNQYYEVIGATPVFLKGFSVAGKDIYRTDLKFGTGDRKLWLLICSEQVLETLKKQKLRGLKYAPVWLPGVPENSTREQIHWSDQGL